MALSLQSLLENEKLSHIISFMVLVKNENKDFRYFHFAQEAKITRFPNIIYS
jgi:hypothetical protein